MPRSVSKRSETDVDAREWRPVHNSRIELGESFVIDKDRVKGLIADLDEELAMIDECLRQMVGGALATGLVSWTDVGEALGITRQGANQRFRGARVEMRMAEDKELVRQTMRRIGARRERIMYELRDAKGGVVLRRRDPAGLLGQASEMVRSGASAAPVIVKVYPDGIEREMDVEAVREWAKKRATKVAKRGKYTPGNGEEEF